MAANCNFVKKNCKTNMRENLLTEHLTSFLAKFKIKSEKFLAEVINLSSTAVKNEQQQNINSSDTVSVTGSQIKLRRLATENRLLVSICGRPSKNFPHT